MGGWMSESMGNIKKAHASFSSFSSSSSSSPLQLYKARNM